MKLGKDLAQRFFSFFSWGYYYFSARRLLCKNEEIHFPNEDNTYIKYSFVCC